MAAHQLILLMLILLFPSSIWAQGFAKSTVIVHSVQAIANTDENFICATIDWWPYNKCNYGQCPWHHTSIINLDLSHPLLSKAIRAFGNLRIRIGGSLQDQVLYHLPSLKANCHPFFKKTGGLFGFSKGCLHMERWDAINSFLSRNGAIITFGLNALHGRKKTRSGSWVGPWDSTNTYHFIRYTISKRYKIDSWEFGNELSGNGVGARVDVVQYGKDVIKLKNMIDHLYGSSHSKPGILAPGGFYNQAWFSKLLQVTGPGVINALTHHIYNLGSGIDPNLLRNIRDPYILNRTSSTFDSLEKVIKNDGPWSSAWVGEAGGAFNNGGHLISDTFLNSFWYLDQLGMASAYNTKVYCRQTLIGGNYGLLNTTTLTPNPDYYSALLWHRLMGRRVLSISSSASPYLRTYAHCTKGKKEGVTLVFINLSEKTRFSVDVERSQHSEVTEMLTKGSSIRNSLNSRLSWVGRKVRISREEYHLTPKDGYLRSQRVNLNGKPLEISEKGEIPRLEPVFISARAPIHVSPSSIAFVVIPDFDALACR